MDTRLSDVLVSFREEVNALAVILLDARRENRRAVRGYSCAGF